MDRRPFLSPLPSFSFPPSLLATFFLTLPFFLAYLQSFFFLFLPLLNPVTARRKKEANAGRNGEREKREVRKPVILHHF